MEYKVGDIMGEDILHRDYQGPPGTVNVIQFGAEFPSDTLVFIKDRKVILVAHRDKVFSLSDFPAPGTYDAMLVRYDQGPEAMMGKEWMQAARADTKRYFS